MARPKTDYPAAAAVRALADDAGRLAVRVTPGARVESVEIGANKLLVKLRAKPTDGQANAALIALLAKALDCAPSQLELLRGATSREKLVQLGD
ncbi:MAG: DUF167 domain-containing protein [Sphingomonadaceae bacterium]